MGRRPLTSYQHGLRLRYFRDPKTSIQRPGFWGHLTVAFIYPPSTDDVAHCSLNHTCSISGVTSMASQQSSFPVVRVCRVWSSKWNFTFHVNLQRHERGILNASEMCASRSKVIKKNMSREHPMQIPDRILHYSCTSEHEYAMLNVGFGCRLQLHISKWTSSIDGSLKSITVTSVAKAGICLEWISTISLLYTIFFRNTKKKNVLLSDWFHNHIFFNDVCFGPVCGVSWINVRCQ